MAERITEAELLDVELAVAPSVAYAPGVTEAQANLARGVLRYIAEVRRLRGLILDAFDRAKVQPTHAGDDWIALLDEVGAIREESL